MPSLAQKAAILCCTTGVEAPGRTCARKGTTTTPKRAPSAATSARSARSSSKKRAKAARTLGESGATESSSTSWISRRRAPTRRRTSAERA